MLNSIGHAHLMQVHMCCHCLHLLVRWITCSPHCIQMGVIEDQENRNRLAKLLRFYSSKSEEEMSSLEQYVSRMKSGQKGIYYMAADTVEVARAAPFVEKLVADGYEVLYLTEAIDEAVVTNMAKYADHDLIDVSKEGLDLGDGEQDGKKVTSHEPSLVYWLCCCLLGVSVSGVCCAV